MIDFLFVKRFFVGFVAATLVGQVCLANPTKPSKSTALNSPVKSNTHSSHVKATATNSSAKATISNPPTKSNPSVDWTPILKTMQNGCDLPDFESLPPALVATLTTEGSDKSQKVMGNYKVLNLKNASAWGLPIKKIQYGAAGAGFSSATVYFSDDRFMKLRDKFYIQTASGKLRAIDKTVISDRNAFAGQYLANGVGYNDGRVGVNFSSKTHSITCSWAHLTS